jgi:hypothetical protein
MSKGLLTALLLSIVLAVSLSFLPAHAFDRWGGSAFLERVKEGRDVPVAQMNGVVDSLGAMKLSGRLQKVEWEKERLVVWLAFPEQRLQAGRPYQDVYRIIYRFLVESPQLREAEVRVGSLENPENVRFTVQASRSSMANAPKPDSPQVPAFVQSNLKVAEKKSP